MSRPMIQSAVTMNQLQQKLDLIGHNLANSETTGYKGKHAAFSSLLFQQINNLRDPANAEGRLTRSEERRVGKEGKCGWGINEYEITDEGVRGSSDKQQ